MERMRPTDTPFDPLERIGDMAGRIGGVYIEEIRLEEPFVDFSARFASDPGTVVLLSGGDPDCARYHILGTRPWLSLKSRGREIAVSSGRDTFCCELDPFEAIRRLMKRYRIEEEVGHDLPIAAGLLGYFSYDLKDHVETLPRTSVDDLGLPGLCLYAPSVIVVHDNRSNRTTLCLPKRTLSKKTLWKESLTAFRAALIRPNEAPGGFSGDIDGLRSGFTRPEYIEAVRRIKEYIISGHVYQVNMSQRFETIFEGDPFALYKKLFEMNPAPFFAYVNAGDHFIVSTSPERFIKLEGVKVEARPIKGTRPRGRTPEEDEKYKRQLMESVKDEAELSMIVDLLRNDIGKVCRAGSVGVVEHKRLESYRNVFHLVSVVVGELAEDKEAVDLIRAAFPGGSITGCPKIRAMEIIDELEPVRRHVYTGSIGYMDFRGHLDLSIAIRTAMIVDNKIFFSVGGGVVYDSDPEDEYLETLHKGRTLLGVFEDAGMSVRPDPAVWFNGKYLPASQALVPAVGWGLRYGFGFFETIRADNGLPLFLPEHMARFDRTWKTLFKTDPPDITWKEVIGRVLEKNRLEDKTAAVNVLAALQTPNAGRPEITLLATARPYVYRFKEKRLPGLALVTCPEARQTPLADHKTLNYLYYLLAGQWAEKNGGHEALIVNPDGSLSETNTANILLVKDRDVIKPVSPHVLPGIMEEKVLQILKARGYRVTSSVCFPESLFQVDDVLLTNSLMGAAPVLSLDGETLREGSDLWKDINRVVLGDVG